MPTRNIQVRAKQDAAGVIDFEVDGVKAKHARLKFDKGSGSHDIHFQLHDQSGRGLQFNQADPIWIDEDAPCPPTPGITTDQLTVTECGSDRLSTINQNSGRARELRYQLNFIAADGSKADCDPIVDNGGGVGGSQ
jgi:hypothetical protein